MRVCCRVGKAKEDLLLFMSLSLSYMCVVARQRLVVDFQVEGKRHARPFLFCCCLCIRDKTNVCFYQVSFSFENKVSNFVFFLVELLLLRLFPPYLNCSLNTAGCNKINAGDGDCVWCSGGMLDRSANKFRVSPPPVTLTQSPESARCVT